MGWWKDDTEKQPRLVSNPTMLNSAPQYAGQVVVKPQAVGEGS